GEALGALRCVQAEAHHWQGEMGAAAMRAREAMQHLPTGERLWHHAFVYAAIVASKAGNVDELVALIGVLRPGNRNDAPHVVASLALSAYLTSTGRVREGREVLAAVEGFARQLEGDPVIGYRLDQALMFCAYAEGDIAGVLRHTRSAVSHSERAGRIREELLQRANLAEAMNLLGLYEEAVAVAQSCLGPTRRFGF